MLTNLQFYVEATGELLTVSSVAMILVFFAMSIDLIAGLYKAKQRQELRTSDALKRSLVKFISYEGGLAIACMVDILIHYSKLYQLIGLRLLEGVPVISIVVGIFLLIVEFLSVSEKADSKTKKQQDKAINALAELLKNKNLQKLLKQIDNEGKDEDSRCSADPNNVEVRGAETSCDGCSH